MFIYSRIPTECYQRLKYYNEYVNICIKKTRLTIICFCRRMTRATILLIPLFGVQFLVTLVRPQTDDCDLEQVYYYIFYTMDGLQGTSVALLYCYFNKEVRIIYARRYAALLCSCINIKFESTCRNFGLLGSNYL